MIQELIGIDAETNLDIVCELQIEPEILEIKSFSNKNLRNLIC